MRPDLARRGLIIGRNADAKTGNGGQQRDTGRKKKPRCVHISLQRAAFL